jgi:hypothetical protein
MRSAVRAARTLLAAILVLAGTSAPGGDGLERTLFRDIPPADPAREVIQAVLGSPFYSMRQGFSNRDWAGEGYAAAWERARRYFPGKAYFVRPGTYFMTHGFSPEGRLFMEIHESAYLALCVENRQTFTPGSVVASYGRMVGAADGREAAAFRKKLGRLETFFRDEPAHQVLRKALGGSLFLRLMRELREEDYHMLAGGLMHEGMHAGMDDAFVARVQSEFKAGERPVQWDELRAFMAEVSYHGAFSNWAEDNIAASWGGIGSSLGELEALRKRPLLLGQDRTKLENAKVEAWAFAALVRLRMREIWQSARRIQDLVESFRRDYVKAGPPADVAALLDELSRDAGGFSFAAGAAIQRSELALLALESLLDVWSDWAAGRRPFPPPVTDSNDTIKMKMEVSWPDPPAGAAGALMKRAGQALEKERAFSGGGRRAPKSSRRPDTGPAFSAG